MAIESNANVSKGVVVIGGSVAAIQAALTLAQMGIKVEVITNSVALGWNGSASEASDNSPLDQRFFYPLSIQVTSHPLITLHTGAEAESVEGEKGDFKIHVVQHPRYVREDICTGCGRCQAECSVNLASLLKDEKIRHSAIHTPLLETKAVPSTYIIDKNGTSPCQVACPLGINVQGFVSLLANNKTDKALSLINEAAPLAGILGRVCTHPCENGCNRAQVDNPVSIRALHRYTADNATKDIEYIRKSPARSREGKIAIVGSGPAGLTAAWELTRRGYSPAVFESHGVIGGMLATGIPRFRLPREIRDREIEAIKKLGLDIRTGITIGRDVTFAYLKERSYRAFFLAIGAQQNAKLNIPGEDILGVVDCIPLLLTLNLKVDVFVGSNVVVIGGGNAAIDAARAALRSGASEVTIFYRRTRAEMPAIPEEVEEAINEGVKIEFLTIPVEILGDGDRVAGIHLQRAKLNEPAMDNQRLTPEPISGTDFVVEADHVVVAVGQSPHSPQLNMPSLAINSNTDVIQVNPLTLETNIPGVFAGGDCITGPNNVVDAMAAGMRAAESIDRYMQGSNLETGRSLEPPEIAEVNMETLEISPFERAPMPTLKLHKRTHSFEETTTGLSSEVSRREAQRCLNCGLCSQCMECTNVCELGAVFHDDSTRHFDIEAQLVLRFPSGNFEESNFTGIASQQGSKEDVNAVSPGSDGELSKQVMKAIAVAMETAIDIKPTEAGDIQVYNPAELDTILAPVRRESGQSESKTESVGVFLCSCGGSISSVMDFKTLLKKLSLLPGVAYIREVAQACTETGARQITSQVTEQQLDRVVLAACRCCNSEQVCYSCTDRRMMCQQFLNEHLILPHNTIVEFVNIREQCAWIHKDNPKSATRKAVQIISAGIARAKAASATVFEEKSILPSALIIGDGLVSTTAAEALASRGYHVELVATKGPEQNQLIEPLSRKNVIVKTWPNVLKIEGSPGDYEAVLEYGHQVDHVRAGALLVDTDVMNEGVSPILSPIFTHRLIGCIAAGTNNSGQLGGTCNTLLRDVTIKETAGVFPTAPVSTESPEEQVLRGMVVAARVSTYLEQTIIRPRAMAVKIDNALCRGCGNCADICPYIDMLENTDGIVHAHIDKFLCLGCGACIATCPAGAITQPCQSDKQIIHTLRSMLPRGQILSEV